MLQEKITSSTPLRPGLVAGAGDTGGFRLPFRPFLRYGAIGM